MPRTPRSPHLVLTLLIAVFSALLLAACGDDSGGGGASDLADLAPPGTPVFVQGAVRPEGDLKANIEDMVQNVAGIDAGEQIVRQIDAGLAEQDLTWEGDISPWLGTNGAVFISGFGGGDVETGAVLVETTDSGAAEDFVAKLAESESGVREEEYEGVSYRSDGEFAVGLVNDVLVGGDPQAFEAAVDASNGDSLADDSDFSATIDQAPEDSLADVYVNIDDFLAAVEQRLDPQAKRFFDSLGGGTDGAGALASIVVPSSNRVELDFLSNAYSDQIPVGDAADFLGSFPADSWAAFATPAVGDRIAELIDQVDASGIPPDVPPGALKQQLSSAGFDVDKLASAIGDVGFFVGGEDRASIDGALVITTDDQATADSTIEDLADLARRSGTPGVRPIAEGTGFTIRDPQELGPKPLVVQSSGGRIAVAYGQDAADAALASDGGETLDSSETFNSAKGALEGADPAGFVDFEPILALAESLGASSDPDYAIARPYLEKLDYLVFGSGKDGDFVTSKVVLALTE
jgi:hypothetical protein